MKLQSVLLFLATLFFFSSCEKEYSAENGGTPDSGGTTGGTAKYTFDGGTGSCTGAVVSGIYTAGTALAAANTVSILVDVDSIGTYIVSSSTTNGMVFKGTGSFTAVGPQTITLIGTGTPTAAGTFTFSFGTTGCSFSVTVAGSTGGAAVFSLGGSPAACTGFSVAGNYMTGLALVASNTAVLNVNVSTVGSYTINTNAVNGISFSKTGSFTTTGDQTVTLEGTGTPIAEGDFTYTVTSGINSCTFIITTLPAGPAAVGTLDCAAITQAGTYTQGSVLNSSNTISIPVNVTTAGSYSITTAAVNGVTFSGAGMLAAGSQNIELTGNGTPVAPGTNSFSIDFGTSNCSVSVNFLPGTNPSANFLRCKIDGVLTNFNTGLVGYNVDPPSADFPYSVSVQGKISDVPNGTQEFWVNIQNPGSTPATGNYSNVTFANPTGKGCNLLFYPTGFPNLYWGASVLNANTCTVTLSTISANGATGTFSGTIVENNGIGPLTKIITEGEFKISF